MPPRTIALSSATAGMIGRAKLRRFGVAAFFVSPQTHGFRLP